MRKRNSETVKTFNTKNLEDVGDVSGFVHVTRFGSSSPAKRGLYRLVTLSVRNKLSALTTAGFVLLYSYRPQGSLVHLCITTQFFGVAL